MSRNHPVAAKILLSMIVLVLTLCIGVGVVDMLTGRSVLHGALNSGFGAAPRMAMTDEERVAAAAHSTGSFSAALDPHVGITMMRGATRKVVDCEATMDEHGMRVRVGPKAGEKALRIVVLGDSVAFGFGVADDQTIAHHLEAYLAPLMPEDSPRPVVHTIACPGWNHRNSCRYLRNHFARLEPDIVLFLPVGNDLHDAYTVNEVGHRSLEYDAARGAGYPHTSAEQWIVMMSHYAGSSVAARLRVQLAGGPSAVMPHAVMSGLTPESLRRWEVAMRETTELRDHLVGNDCRFAISFFVYEEYMSQFHVRVAKALPEVPLFWSFLKLTPDDRLKTDPHPNPRYTKAMAWCLARDLLAKKWVPGANADALAPLHEAYRDRLAPTVSLPDAEKIVAKHLAIWTDFFSSEIVLRETKGFHQVYGAVHADGKVDRSLWLSLLNAGTGKVSTEIERLRASSGIYPLSLKIEVNGEFVKSVDVPAPEDGTSAAFTFAFQLPKKFAEDEFFDVRVSASTWVVDRDARGVGRLISFGFVRMGF